MIIIKERKFYIDYEYIIISKNNQLCHGYQRKRNGYPELNKKTIFLINQFMVGFSGITMKKYNFKANTCKM